MIDTYQALVVTVLALLPGALYTYAVERQAGRWGANLSDRLLRFVAASAVLHAVLAAGTYQAYRAFVRTHRISQGRPLPWWVWPVVLGYVALPALLGDLVGRAVHQNRGWARVLTGPSPAPRAWDHLFATADRTGWIRLRLLDPGTASGAAADGSEVTRGRWLIGAFSADSYAAGYPDEQDLYLADTALCDPMTGEFTLDPAGDPQLTGTGVLVRWSQVAYLEFIAA